MGGKKNKRGSITSTSSVSKTELNERTPENDYGVLSDPEENETIKSVPLLTETDAVMDPSTPPTVAVVEEPTEHGDDECSHTQTEPSQPSHVSPHSSPSLQPQRPPSQPLNPLSQDQETSQSLDTLKLKLTTDKNYCRKITLHTFFSYIILSIEIERTSLSSDIASISVHNVEKLVDYMIEYHSATDDIKTYLRTLGENKVIKNIILAVIEFNKDQPNMLDNLLSSEEMELEMTSLSESKDTADSSTINPNVIPVTISAAPNEHSNNVPQTPQSCGFLACLRRFFSGCCR